ncbi:flagellar hook-associated protein FlgL [Pseudoxanthomonas suwonensis]|uniref:flagellar hook-associated protein FlgL n=1 Tax=Pseudoxanthomonas suwonensis TaxID=314722 RepID=UPI00138F21CD|nr:flagellar hook-associated protein FlgL [Pseudoxanthomonas suwonensis]KAF1699819.1 flagellar hook-associated protein 3 [Pseudoxanthomonas suwonensis]
MSSRISTSMMFDTALATMLARQKQLSALQQQVATGKKIVTAKDDPVGAGAAVGLDRTLAELERFGLNANTVSNRLGQQENVLTLVGDDMIRINELAVQANTDTLSDDDRKSIAAELRTIRDNLISLANSTDGTGRYLFGGAADDVAPFSRVAGGIAYNGDQTQRSVEIAPGSFVQDTLPGSEVFMRIRTGDGTVDARMAAGNSGTGILESFSRSTAGGWNGESYTIRFTAGNGYEVFDADNNMVGGGTWAPKTDIEFGGLRLSVSGQPADGDELQIGPAGTRDVFATVQEMIDALEAPVVTAGDKAARRNALQASMRDVARAAENMIDARAAGGAQLALVDDAASLREANAVTLKTTLSGMRDLDYADAITRFQLESTALQTAQTVFTRMQGLSLFNLLR